MVGPRPPCDDDLALARWRDADRACPTRGGTSRCWNSPDTIDPARSALAGCHAGRAEQIPHLREPSAGAAGPAARGQATILACHARRPCLFLSPRSTLKWRGSGGPPGRSGARAREPRRPAGASAANPSPARREWHRGGEGGHVADVRGAGVQWVSAQDVRARDRLRPSGAIVTTLGQRQKRPHRRDRPAARGQRGEIVGHRLPYSR